MGDIKDYLHINRVREKSKIDALLLKWVGRALNGSPDMHSIYLRMKVRKMKIAEYYTAIEIPKELLVNGRLIGDTEHLKDIRAQLDPIRKRALELFSLMRQANGFTPSPKEILNRMRRESNADHNYVPFTALVEDYLENNTAQWDDASWGIFRAACKLTYKYVKTTQNKLDYFLHEVDGMWLEKFEAWMRKQEYAIGTIQQYLLKLEDLYKHGLQFEMVPKSPFEGYKMASRDTHVKGEEVLDRAMEKTDLERIESKMALDEEMERIRKIFLFQRWSGWAFDDLINQTVKSCIKLNLNGKKTLTYHRAKNGEIGIIPLFPQLDQLIRELDYDVNPGDYKYYYGAVRAMFKHYNIPYWNRLGAHTGRHVFGSEMLEMGFPIESVSRMMGHKKVETTLKHYAKINKEKLFSDYERVIKIQRNYDTKSSTA